MSDTPRTDANIALIDENGELVRAEFARQLERDLQAMTAARDYEKAAHKRAVDSCHADIKALKRERDGLQRSVADRTEERDALLSDLRKCEQQLMAATKVE